MLEFLDKHRTRCRCSESVGVAMRTQLTKDGPSSESLPFVVEVRQTARPSHTQRLSLSPSDIVGSQVAIGENPIQSAMFGID